MLVALAVGTMVELTDDHSPLPDGEGTKWKLNCYVLVPAALSSRPGPDRDAIRAIDQEPGHAVEDVIGDVALGQQG